MREVDMVDAAIRAAEMWRDTDGCVALVHKTAIEGPDVLAGESSGVARKGVGRMQKPLIYLAHPYSHADSTIRRGNLNGALSYLYVLRRAGLHVIAPWIALVQCEGGCEETRAHGIATDLMVLARCDALVACGLRWSEGMRTEELQARSEGVQIIDCVGMIHRVAVAFVLEELRPC